ncbi:mitochondrial import inner membrane translocase subunit TIM50-like, partial [Triticum dicoccoides]|uniref:mitochondrial import inner membrane translocase subunit TIM50-like n=1 Tax=Triticum dicoccoides TaxID=85692 RepID=UPI0018905216
PASSAAAAEAAAAAAAAAASGAGAEAAATAPPPPAARKGWIRGLLKFGVFTTLVGAIGGAGYATHAYSLSEVDKKTLEFRKEMTTPIPVPEDASEFEKFRARAYETAMKVPVAAIELYLEIRARIEDHVVGFTEPASDKLLPDLHPDDQNIFTLVVDLTDTLVYNDWQRERGWKTFKRPGVEAFLQHMATMYEVVVYSDQLQMYVDPVVERLDSTGQIRKLSRPATKYQDGKHYRDLSKLNRNPAQVLYVSAHALESCLQPENCVTVKPWKLENDDTELLDLIPFLEYLAIARPSDIRAVLASYQGHDVAKEFRKRSKELERHKQAKQRKSIWRR